MDLIKLCDLVDATSDPDDLRDALKEALAFISTVAHGTEAHMVKFAAKRIEKILKGEP